MPFFIPFPYILIILQNVYVNGTELKKIKCCIKKRKKKQQFVVVSDGKLSCINDPLWAEKQKLNLLRLDF